MHNHNTDSADHISTNKVKMFVLEHLCLFFHGELDAHEMGWSKLALGGGADEELFLAEDHKVLQGNGLC